MIALALLLLSQAPAPSAHSGKAELLWLGQSAFRITTPGGKVIVIDPFLTKNPKTPQAWKDLDKLGKIDLLLVTHAHGDHLGDAPVLATKNKAPLYGPAGLDQTLQTLGVLPPDLAPRMNKGGTITRWAPASASTWCGPSTAPSSSGTIPRPARTRRTWAESRSDS